VQVNAAGMDPVLLKEKYGDQLVFWGGGVDTQKVLPFGTPGEVKAHVLKECEIFARDGGFVFNTVHNMQANVPLANVLAMLEAIKQFGS
jgi:uroporphyrinogen-III decarboxylase